LTATAVIVSGDLLFASRLFDAAARAGVRVRRIDTPSELPPASSVRLVLVDWGERGSGWGEALSAWRVSAAPPRQPRLVLYGSHTDLEAHAAARYAGLGPMWGRARLLREVPQILEFLAAAGVDPHG
jgi:hypothetical protein